MQIDLGTSPAEKCPNPGVFKGSQVCVVYTESHRTHVFGHAGARFEKIKVG